MSVRAEANAIISQRKVIFPGSFWILQRTGGFAAKLIRIKQLREAPFSDQLTAALLRQDQERCLELLAMDDSAQAQQELAKICSHSNIAALLFDRCCQLQLESAMNLIRLPDGMTLLSALKREAAVAISRFNRLDVLFSDLAHQLQDFGASIVWLKGPVLARSLYAQPYFRLSEDFDIFVSWQSRHAVIERLVRLGFKPILNDPGHCHQLGIGPVETVDELAIAPSLDFEHCHNLAMFKQNTIMLELKFDPLEQGLRMLELPRFEADSQKLSWSGGTFYAPDIADHLILELTHFHKHFFTGWQWLYDIHLLACELSKSADGWVEFVRRCRSEGITASAWAGLDLAADYLSTPVPPEVLRELAPQPEAATWWTFMAGTEFLWNTTSLPELLFDALFLGNRARKLRAIKDCLFPTAEFLSQYYCRGRTVTWFSYPFVWLLHMLVLLLPGGLVRRTFGSWLWTVPSR